ncbi:glutaredoxin 3 [Acetobacter vaccinii]|uniref:Glutaredoxin n=1 Tax=Acetobacter vaccinii TaxID=2592655 RepID=A0A5C1YQU6_9PROT|nr:glutaredoxin 3 [Acetobacter vaccinii]QEO18391.1 glutaredoxin 3 [Acetobacter vaccinii]
MPQIEIYTQPGCPYCIRAVGLLESKKVDFKEINAPRGTKEREESIERSGGRTTVPQVFVDGQLIGGCDDLMALERQGQLDAKLGLG